MRALEILGLEPGADERAIKRAYARLLKGCRPDDDPQGFQELRDAYEAALERARRGVADGEDDEDGDGDYQEFDVSGAQTPPAIHSQAEKPPLKHDF
ncbi:DnaJ domain-containing protein, partial [Cronobacter malonaticus]